MAPSRGDPVIYFDAGGVPKNALVVERDGDLLTLVIVEDDATDTTIVRGVQHLQPPGPQANRWAWLDEVGF